MSRNFTNADEVIGLDLYAAKTVTAYDYPDEPRTVVATYQPGDRVGTVYSYVLRNEQIWWQFENGQHVKHEVGLFDFEAFEEQGGKTLKEIEREKQLLTAGVVEKYMLKAFWAIQDSKKAQIVLYVVAGLVLFILLAKALNVTGIDLKTLKIKRK